MIECIDLLDIATLLEVDVVEVPLLVQLDHIVRTIERLALLNVLTNRSFHCALSSHQESTVFEDVGIMILTELSS